MKRHNCWVSAVSASEHLSVDSLPALIPTGPVPVFLMFESTPIGMATQYEVREDSIWAFIEIPEGVTFAQAASIINTKAGPPTLTAILLTDMSREDLRRRDAEWRQRSKVN